MNASLRIGAHRFDATDLKRGVDLLGPDLPGASENTRAALSFCAAWLRGDPTFPIETSGSTGAPKMIELTRAQMEASARATAAALGLEAGMVSLVCLPARYVAGRMMLVRTLVLGLEGVLAEPVANPLAGLDGARIDFAAFVPLQVEAILASAQRTALEPMRAVLVGGAPLSLTLEAALRPLPTPLFHTYGMTETATHVALRRLTGPEASTRFRPLPGVETALDERGCLTVRGPMTGGGWIVTNDLAAIEADGSFSWLGRADHVINSGGVKVQVEPLEAALEPLLAALGGVAWGGRRFFAAGLSDGRLGQIVALVAEGAPLSVPVEEALLAGLRRALGPFETPRRIVYAPRFAETPTAKVDRRATLATL